jgi:F-type H+-transporting ATPase subunit c
MAREPQPAWNAGWSGLINKELEVMFTRNKRAIASLAAISTVGLVPSSAFAQAVGSAANTFDMQAAATIGASLAIGLAVLGGALGQGKAAAAALEGISRNPGATARIQTPMIIGLALIESLVLFAFAVAFLLQQKAG